MRSKTADFIYHLLRQKVVQKLFFEESWRNSRYNRCVFKRKPKEIKENTSYDNQSTALDPNLGEETFWTQAHSA
jgi:hypothetical protein